MSTIASSELLESLGGLCVVLTFLGSIALWALKNIIISTVDSALERFEARAVTPLRQEIVRLHEIVGVPPRQPFYSSPSAEPRN